MSEARSAKAAALLAAAKERLALGDVDVSDLDRDLTDEEIDEEIDDDDLLDLEDEDEDDEDTVWDLDDEENGSDG